MKIPTLRVTLARSELDYLEAANFLSPALVAYLRNAEWRSATAATLELLPTTAEEFRGAFTEQLARVGFDEAYEPTPEGKLLEDLIDRFHSPSLSDRLRQKLHLKRYLDELSALTGRSVQADELGSLEQAAAMRMVAQRADAQSSARCEIRFTDRSSERFRKFLQRLTDANPSSVYVWTPRTIDCGALLVASLAAIKFDFDFAINDEGILAFTTSDLADSLLLDFSSTPAGEQLMTVETQGPNWASAVY